MSNPTSKPMTATQINAIQEEALVLMRELNEYAQKHYRSQPRCTCDLMSICTRLYSALIKRLGSSSDETSADSEALKLANDVGGAFTYFEAAVRAAIGNTNYTVIMDRVRRIVDEKCTCKPVETNIPSMQGMRMTSESCPLHGFGLKASEHRHTDECWEPDSGCDMGRNEKYVSGPVAPGSESGANAKGAGGEKP